MKRRVTDFALFLKNSKELCNLAVLSTDLALLGDGALNHKKGLVTVVSISLQTYEL